MKDPSYSIRVAVATALNGILWDGQPVPIYDEMPDDAVENTVRILLQEISGGGERFSKCGHGGDWSQVIKVTHIFPGTARVKKDAIEYISDQILQRLSPDDNYLDISPDFSIWKTYGNIVGNQSYEDGVKKYIDRNLRITYSLVET